MTPSGRTDAHDLRDPITVLEIELLPRHARLRKIAHREFGGGEIGAHDLMSLGHGPRDQVAADKTGSPGDKQPHLNPPDSQ